MMDMPEYLEEVQRLKKLPFRQYMDTMVMPLMLDAIVQLTAQSPHSKDPIDFLINPLE